MSFPQRLGHWLDIRPDEVGKVALSCAGAFLIIAFLILARSLREALYLTAFPVETLPYITAAVAVLSVPTVAFFSRTLARYHPRTVVRALAVLLAAGLALLWPVATRVDVAVVLFYLWTALGTLLITSGFWVVTSEHFGVRGAKRLYGLIGAGGTAGAMVMGNSLVWLTTRLDLIWLVPGLIALLLIFVAVQSGMPASPETAEAPRDRQAQAPLREGLTLAWQSPHLRTIAFIVFAGAIATTLLDYQFKELARASLTTPAELTGFFGAFYGWAGLAALILQLLVAARIMTNWGIAATLAVLPVILIAGSAGMLIVPSLVLVTIVRGADSSLGKSIYRSAIEVLFVPLPAMLRRKTKTFIDSVVDSVGEGLGAALVFFWVTLPGLPSRYLSVYVILFAALLVYLSRRMGRRYFETVTARLQEGGAEARALAEGYRLEGRDLISGTFTNLDISRVVELAEPLSELGIPDDERTPPPADAASEGTPRERLGSPDPAVVHAAIDALEALDEDELAALARLLARDTVYARAAAKLIALGDRAVGELVRLLRDERTDFVIRRRVPRILARIGGAEADSALLDALAANRFEVRYRAAIALVQRRRRGLPRAARSTEPIVWTAIRAEVSRERPVWELQKVLDRFETDEDSFVTKRVGVRGELSLEHTFRLLTLVLDPEAVRAAFNGVLVQDDRLRSYALEYLEQVLPPDIRRKLWPFIGDVSEYQREKSRRPLDQVVSDLITTDATLFAGEEQAALRRMLEDSQE